VTDGRWKLDAVIRAESLEDQLRSDVTTCSI